MKGLILVNAYVNTGDIAYQPERLKEEFEKLGVKIDIKPNKFFPIEILDGNISSSVCDYDFCIFLDKDKYVLKALEKTGIPLYNAYEPITVCDDKMLTIIELANHGVKMPKTLPGLLCFDERVEFDENCADTVIEKLSLPVIVKECFGSLGKGVHLAKTREELISICKKVKEKPHLFQEFISSSYGKDIRVIVIGSEAIGGILRVSDNDFRSNISSGGHGEQIELSEKIKNEAIKIAKLLNLKYCGMDFLIGADGEPLLCEVNSNAFFKGFEKVTGINVAKKYAKFIINDLKTN